MTPELKWEKTSSDDTSTVKDKAGGLTLDSYGKNSVNPPVFYLHFDFIPHFNHPFSDG